ncbi:MAG: 5-oxoprolinase subunit PxpA [Actinomycetales bacterium]
MDLNADVGESFGRWALGDDAPMLQLVTSANVACGFHAGDPTGIMTTCRLAMQSNVVVGAQVGYRDLAGFGRRFIDVSGPDLKADVIYQVGALQGLARAVGTTVRYVKPHGALYHAVARHEEQARAVIAAVLTNDDELAVVGPPGSMFLSLASGAGLRTVREGFADRGYGADGQLLARGTPGAVITDAGAVATQATRLAQSGEYDTLCLHSDTPGAVTLAQAARRALAAARIQIAPFLR